MSRVVTCHLGGVNMAKTPSKEDLLKLHPNITPEEFAKIEKLAEALKESGKRRDYRLATPMTRKPVVVRRPSR